MSVASLKSSWKFACCITHGRPRLKGWECRCDIFVLSKEHLQLVGRQCTYVVMDSSTVLQTFLALVGSAEWSKDENFHGHVFVVTHQFVLPEHVAMSQKTSRRAIAQ